jgi:site-specific DNA-methyltransferase (adenine-specific)
MIERNIIYNEDCQVVISKIPDNNIDCVITSPPYWHLRQYDIGKDGNNITQLGQESMPEEYINNLMYIFNSIRRILKPEGSMFVNIGETYYKMTTRKRSMVGIPDRLKIAFIESGWYVHNDIIWVKDTYSLDPVKDRFTNNYERIFFITKVPKGYYFKQPRIPFAESTLKRVQYAASNKKTNHRGMGNDNYQKMFSSIANKEITHRAMRSVWDLKRDATTLKFPYLTEHSAKFDMNVVRLLIDVSTPEQLSDGTKTLVFDPFMGVGSVAVVARYMGRDFIGAEISKSYWETSQRFLNDTAGLFDNLFDIVEYKDMEII